MQVVLRALASRWTISLAGVVILALLIWFFGPLLDALEGWLPRSGVRPGSAACLGRVEPVARRRSQTPRAET